MIQTPDISFKSYRFPPQIVAHAVWFYLRFNVSLREVEEMLIERGIDVSYEAVLRWTSTFGPQIARNLRRRQAHPGDIWYLDEVVVKRAGGKFWLWRAVDQHGTVLEEILQKRRDKRAVKRLLVALRRHGFVPKRIITDKLRSYGAARAAAAPGLDHWSHKGLNNRAENSHLPFRKREQTMRGHRSPGALQRFVAMHSLPAIAFQFRPTVVAHKQFATIALKHSVHGKLPPASPENSGTSGTAQPGKLNVITPFDPMGRCGTIARSHLHQGAGTGPWQGNAIAGSIAGNGIAANGC